MRRIGVIGHMHVNPDNRELFELLMERDEVKFLFPKKWRGSFKEKYEDSDGFDKIKLPFMKNSYIPIFRSSENYDILWIDEEPYYPQTYFIIKHFEKTPVKIVRTAQNIIKRSFLRKKISDFVNSNIKMIVGVGQTSSKVAKDIYKRENVPIVPLSIPDRFFEVEKNREGIRDKVCIGFASRLEKCKGTDWLLNSIEKIKYPYKLLICGDGKERARFLKELENRKIDFEYRGLITHQKMDGFYRDVDIFLSLSISNKNWIEQQGRTVLEAMASGCVVISSDSGELNYTMNDKECKIKENDTEELSEKINWILSDRNRIYSISERQKKLAYAFSKMEVFKKLDEVLRINEYNDS